MFRAPWIPLTEGNVEHVRLCLEPWVGTPYGAGQGVAGVATDCVRSLAGVGAALEGTPSRDITHLPPDTALHKPDEARAAMREIMSNFPLWERIRSPKDFQPGDMVVVGKKGCGPGHGIFVSHRERMFIEATPRGFHYTGIGSIRKSWRIFSLYRYTLRGDWK